MRIRTRSNNDARAELIIRTLAKRQSKDWARLRQSRVLEVFQRAAASVPAYRDFLKKHHVDSRKIRTSKDFESVPVTSKKNYLQQYPIEKLVWGGNLRQHIVYTATSGSTGEPFYFPRSGVLDWQYSILVDWFLRNSSHGDEGPTLVVIGFGMGVWIGGLITYKAFEIASQRRPHHISIITPGVNKAEIFSALKQLAPHYRQTVLVGYPPFVKDILDDAEAHGVHLKTLNLRLLFAAEAFSEQFRDYLVAKAGIRNPYLDTLNIYGSADLGAMAHETPTSILLRRMMMREKELFRDFFGAIDKTPTLAQFHPGFANFEAPQGDILLTGDNTIPLIRYAIGDHGGVATFDECVAKVRAHGIDFTSAAKRAGVSGNISRQPLVYVYERSDFSTKLYGAIIYPEHVREALQSPTLSRSVTGKFVLMTKFNRKHEQYLEVNIELKPKVVASAMLRKRCEQEIVDHLLEKNSEYKNNYVSVPKKVWPRVVFWPYEHPAHFKPGIKQKWVKKDI